jgi:uncharacterized cupin superfamily protein
MSDHYSKVNEMESRGLHAVMRLWKDAREYKWTSSKIHDKFLEYKKFNKLDKYPRYVSSYLQGVFDCEKAKVQFNELEFCYVIEGKLYSTHGDSPRFYESHGFSPKEVYDKASHSGHYWIGSDKPYYVSPK